MENRPLRIRRDIESQMARRREAEKQKQDEWTARSKYYDKCEKQNAKFEAFTSPRYYEENNRLYTKLTAQREKAENLEKRKEALRKLFLEDQQTYDIELMMTKCTPRSWEDDSKNSKKSEEIPLEILQKVNNNIKEQEERRRRRRAEVGLYEHWRLNDPNIKDAERKVDLGKVKMSWLDQQIQKRMQKEKEEEEAREFILKSKQNIEEYRKEQEMFKREAEKKKEKFKRDLENQMKEILKREEESSKLRREEEIVQLKRLELQKIESKWEEDERHRRTEAVALDNQKFHKRKLEIKAQQVLQELEQEREFIQRVQELELCDKIRDQAKKQEVQESMNQFLSLVGDLKDLEIKRKRHMQFVFDSEAADVFHQFDSAWRKEEKMRKDLVEGILTDLRCQIDEHLDKAKEDQKQIMKEREEMIEKMERYKEDMEAIKIWEENKKDEYRRALDQQIATKKNREKELKQIEKDRVCEEFEKLRNEEARLKEEILRVQKGVNVPTYGRRSFFH